MINRTTGSDSNTGSKDKTSSKDNTGAKDKSGSAGTKKYAGKVSIQVKIISIIIISTLFIILFSVSAGIIYVQNSIKMSQESDLSLVALTADRYLSSEISRLKEQASNAAYWLAQSGTVNWLEAVEHLKAVYPEFIGMTVFDEKEGKLFYGGEVTAPIDIMDNECIKQAFYGNIAISSSVPLHNLASEEYSVAFYLAAPLPGMPGKILVLTLPQMFLADRLQSIAIWGTGHIFVDDKDGSIISNKRAEWIHSRQNFIKLAETDPSYEQMANVLRHGANGEDGTGYFSIDGELRLCAYRPISGSEEGWFLGVIAPLQSSPFKKLETGLIIVGLLSLFLGIVAAVIASGFIKKPFDEIAVLKEKAEAGSKAKSDFLANTSHEMRTPLNAVLGLSGLTLEMEGLNEEAISNLEKIYSSGATLLSIVNDILDISKIEAGKLELIPHEYDMPSLINDVITQNILRIGSKIITFTLDIGADIPATLYGDDLRIKQILNNLLSNAFKYTKEGTVELGIRANQSEYDETVWVKVWVKDTGAGIRPEDIEKLFTNYTQFDAMANRAIEGTGLGLHITKMIVEMMYGTISVESEFGKGSTFTVNFKQKHVSDKTIGKAVADNLKNFKHSDAKRMQSLRVKRIRMPYARVLLVDDNLTNLDVAKGLMKPYGMQIDCVTSGPDAIAAFSAEKDKYSAIFMDHMMPGMDGLEAMRRIRELDMDCAKNIPIIALTANAITGNAEKFINSGFQDFLTKPIDIPRLDEALRRWVRDIKKEGQLSGEGWGIDGEPVADGRLADGRLVDVSMADELGAYEPVADGRLAGFIISGMDIQKGLERFDCDTEAYIDVLRSYRINTMPILERIKKINEANLVDYAIDVHGIKGSSRGIYANSVGDLAEMLEKAAKAGDIEFVNINNARLLESSEKLLMDIENLLSAIDAKNPKGKHDRLDREVLLKLSSFCADYDIDGINAMMCELGKYDYDDAAGGAAEVPGASSSGAAEGPGGVSDSAYGAENAAVLLAWLKDNVLEGNFDIIAERLTKMTEQESA